MNTEEGGGGAADGLDVDGGVVAAVEDVGEGGDGGRDGRGTVEGGAEAVEGAEVVQELGDGRVPGPGDDLLDGEFVEVGEAGDVRTGFDQVGEEGVEVDAGGEGAAEVGAGGTRERSRGEWRFGR